MIFHKLKIKVFEIFMSDLFSRGEQKVIPLSEHM